MPADDVQELLRSLHAGVELERKVTELRPSRDTLGSHLQNYSRLLQLAIDREVIDRSIAAAQASIGADDFDEREFDQFAWRPANGSPACAERETLSAAGVSLERQRRRWHQDYGRTVSVARRLIEAFIDNLRAIALLLQDGEITRGPIALSRVVLDAAAHACFLLAPDIAASERMRRTLNEELALLVADYKAALAEDDPQRHAEHEEEIAEIRQAAESCGFEEFASMPTHDRQRRLITSVKPSDNTPKMIDLALSNPGPFWHQLSAIVHSQEDMGIRLLLSLESSGPSPRA